MNLPKRCHFPSWFRRGRITGVNLTKDPAKDRHSQWSPKRTRIAFEFAQTGSCKIFVTDHEGGGLLSHLGPGVHWSEWEPNKMEARACPSRGTRSR